MGALANVSPGLLLLGVALGIGALYGVLSEPLRWLLGSERMFAIEEGAIAIVQHLQVGAFWLLALEGIFRLFLYVLRTSN